MFGISLDISVRYATGLFCQTFYFWLSAVFFFSGELVGYVTLRLLKPMCSINPAWFEENLSSATKNFSPYSTPTPLLTQH